jgi:hypothetical protein
MMPGVSRLGARFAPALAFCSALPLVAGQSVGGRWFGGVGRVQSVERQLLLQVRDLLFRICDLLFRVCDLLFGVCGLPFGVYNPLFGVDQLLVALR